MPQPNPKSIKIVPNIERVLIKLLTTKDMVKQSAILLPGQLKAGENLLYGEIIDAGPSKTFKPGDHVYYSEYSASALFPVGKMIRGEITIGEMNEEKNLLYCVAEDDIMAYEAEGEQYVSAFKKQEAREELHSELFGIKQK